MRNARYFTIILALALISSLAWADDINKDETVSLSGPRLGISYLHGDMPAAFDTLESGYYTTQFGYYFEYQFVKADNLALATDIILLMGGMEKGMFVPSLTWVTGFRLPNNLEFGFGPNYTPLVGLGYTVATGMTFKYGNLYLPINVAFVFSRDSQRISFLTGFSGEIKI